MKKKLGIVILLFAALFMTTQFAFVADARAGENCMDKIDNDDDGLIDCDDPDCDVNLFCILGGGSTTTEDEVCTDDIDNDGDGLVDCDDDDCKENLLCLLSQPDDETCNALPSSPVFYFVDDSTEIESLYIYADTVYVDEFDTDFVEVHVDVPCYEGAADIFIAVKVPDGRMFFIDDDGMLSADFVSYRTGESESVTDSLVYASIPDGEVGIYWMISPTLTGNFMSAFNRGMYELGGHTFQLNVDDSE